MANLSYTSTPFPKETHTIYTGISDRPIGWRSKKYSLSCEPTTASGGMGMKKWDGATRKSSHWDGLRKDPELCFESGNCLVHLYARGQSRRGPAMQIPMDSILAANCRPLLTKCMSHTLPEAPISMMPASGSEDGSYSNEPTAPAAYELYIPASSTIERADSYLYHTATRNFFAWMFGKPLVGSHLGGALVGLLNCMNEFRHEEEDNVRAIMEYMDEAGYADVRNSPNHALGILFFAEHFHFRDLWIDAFAHCTGMHEKLPSSPGFEFISRTSRALITRSRFEMDMRLDEAGLALGSFLSDDLSDAYLGLSSGARFHLDKFRTFLQSYYVAKLGYYPPAPPYGSISAFPRSTYALMCFEFQKLYEFLVDSSFTLSDDMPFSQQGGICVLQSVQSFDSRHKYQGLSNPLPLLPEVDEILPAKPISRRLSWMPLRSNKMKPDPGLVAFASLSKASNSLELSSHECSLVRAYRGFEKDCIFTPDKGDSKLSQKEARRVRWILVYSVLQTLLSVTNIPSEVRDTCNVPYHLSVLTAGCPPWKVELQAETALPTPPPENEDFVTALAKAVTPITPATLPEIKPDIDYFALTHKPQQPQSSQSSTSTAGSRKSSIRKALSTLGNMPELLHPHPKRQTYHEILVHGYGNGTNNAILTSPASPTIEDIQHQIRKSTDSSVGDVSSRWSSSSIALSRRSSDESSPVPLSSSYSSSVYSNSVSAMHPEPLHISAKKEWRIAKGDAVNGDVI